MFWLLILSFIRVKQCKFEATHSLKDAAVLSGMWKSQTCVFQLIPHSVCICGNPPWSWSCPVVPQSNGHSWGKLWLCTTPCGTASLCLSALQTPCWLTTAAPAPQNRNEYSLTNEGLYCQCHFSCLFPTFFCYCLWFYNMAKSVVSTILSSFCLVLYHEFTS